MPRIRYLSEFELHILLAVQRLGDAAHGGSVMREIEQYSGRRVWIGPLYTSLGRLEAKGFLKTKIGEPLAVRGGRARRYVTLTPAGLSALQDSLAMLDRMRVGLRLVPNAGVRR